MCNDAADMTSDGTRSTQTTVATTAPTTADTDANGEHALDHEYPSLQGDSPYENVEVFTTFPSEIRSQRKNKDLTRGTHLTPSIEDSAKESGMKEGQNAWIVPCFETLASHRSREVRHWKHYVQIDGQSYYYLAKGGKRRFSYVTELDVTIGDVLHELEWFIVWIEEEASNMNGIPSDVEVVLDFTFKLVEEGMENRKEPAWTYYMADIGSQGIFCLHDLEIPYTILTKGLRKEARPCSLFTFEYWVHVGDFPKHRQPSWETDQVIGILCSRLLDGALEPKNNQGALFDIQDMKMSLRLIMDLHNSNPPSEYLMSSIATIMIILERDRFRKLRGNPGRILRHFERMFEDGLVSKQERIELQKKLDKASSTFVLYATVFLAVDVSFLAVPTVLGMINSRPLPSDQVTLSSLLGQASVIICLGSIIIGFLKIEESEEYIEADAHGNTSEIHPREKVSQTRLELMALQSSLPLALLLWGISVFALSILTLCFDSNVTIVGITTRRTVYGSVCGIVIALALWTWYTGLRLTDHHWYDVFAQEKIIPEDQQRNGNGNNQASGAVANGTAPDQSALEQGLGYE